MGENHAKNTSGDDRALSVRVFFISLIVLVGAVLAAAVVIVVLRPPFAAPALEYFGLQTGDSVQASSSAQGTDAVSSRASGKTFSEVGDTTPTEAQEAAERAEWERKNRLPLMATSAGVDLYSCVAPADLTGVLFHQASYNYALPIETELPEADYEKVAAERQIRVNTKQKSGEWLDADALHLWRTTDTTAMDTSIDVGALAGTQAVSPVTGTVVLVRDYLLYDEVPDVEIHIQPDGRDDLDCVLIHTTDPAVKAGDHVTGGVTKICSVRDIEKDLTDVQLGFFTPEGVGGNHIHVQMNDANYENYRKTKLKGAIKVK